MSRGVARLGDQTFGICSHPSHVPIKVGGKIISASTDCTANNRGIARLGDTVLTECGHTAKIITASTKYTVNNRGVARLGDQVAGVYVAKIITASSDNDTA